MDDNSAQHRESMMGQAIAGAVFAFVGGFIVGLAAELLDLISSYDVLTLSVLLGLAFAFVYVASRLPMR